MADKFCRSLEAIKNDGQVNTLEFNEMLTEPGYLNTLELIAQTPKYLKTKNVSFAKFCSESTFRDDKKDDLPEIMNTVMRNYIRKINRNSNINFDASFIRNLFLREKSVEARLSALKDEICGNK